MVYVVGFTSSFEKQCKARPVHRPARTVDESTKHFVAAAGTFILAPCKLFLMAIKCHGLSGPLVIPRPMLLVCALKCKPKSGSSVIPNLSE